MKTDSQIQIMGSCQRGRQIGEKGEKGEIDLKVQASSCKLNKPSDVLYSIRNMVSNIVNNFVWGQMVTNLKWQTFHSICQCQIAMQYTQN